MPARWRRLATVEAWTPNRAPVGAGNSFVAFNARSSRRALHVLVGSGRVEVDAFEIGWPCWLVRLLVGTR